MNCRLDRLTLHNFKGVRDFTLEAGGYDVAVYGDNAAGKTTIVDAFSWLLFGKDAEGRADFSIKTLDGAGEAVHGLEHVVEAELLIGERRTTLRKVYAEKWTKKRGSANETFDGHETQHFVDGVPMTKREFDDAVAELAPTDAWQLLTDPSHLAASLHWKKRREILLEVCGDVTDDDVVASDPALADLPEVLAGRTIEERQKILTASRRQINDQREKLPVQIAEADRALPVVDEDEATLRTRLNDLKEGRAAAEDKRASISVGGAVAEKKARLREIDAEVQGIRSQYEAQQRDAVRELNEKLEQARGEANSAATAAARLQEQIAGKREDIERLERQMKERRDRWNARNEEAFEHAEDDTCSACGQKIPEWKLQEARDKAESAFNVAKSRELAEISEEGKQLAARRDRVAAGLPELEQLLNEADKARAAAQEAIPGLEAAIAEARASVPEIDDDKAYQALGDEALRLQGEISNVQDTVQSEIAAARAAVKELDDKIEATQAMLARHAARESGLARIENLKADEVRLAKEYEEVERHLRLIEIFIRAKVDLLTGRINSRFELARWKLFAEQINGGIAECCEVTYQGVPWRDMNHGARIQVGLDIIRTLQNHYGFAPPVFVDQGESVTSLPEMDCQMIRLVVSEPDKELRVETTHEAAMEAPAA